MFSNYLKIAWRNLLRNKVYSLVNITGLALGITAFLMILEYVSFEKSVNQFHKNLPQIYRLLNLGVKGETWAEIEPGWAPKAIRAFPEINDFCRVAEGIGKGFVTSEHLKNESFRENAIGYADGNFFGFFTFPLISGDGAALKKPNVAFLSEKTAARYFAAHDPVGKTLTVTNQFGTLTYAIGGVYKMPSNSDIKFDIILSLETLSSAANLNGNDWAALDNDDSQYINTYFLLHKGADSKALEKKLSTFRDGLQQDKDGIQFRLQAFSDVHLANNLRDHYITSGNVKYVYMLLMVATLILSIAWFNYINLSTANALKRANEVGVRKVIGATPGNLIAQFLGESALINVLALGTSLILVSLLQPLFNELIGKELSLGSLGNSSMWLLGLALLLAGALGSGVYTAYSFSKFNPVKILKGKLTKSSGGVLLRKSLVISQFSISIVLILATIVIYSQLKFMQTRNLGINTSNLLVVRGPELGKDSSYKTREGAFLNELRQQSFIKDYSLSGTVPGNWFNFATSGFSQPGSKPGDELESYSFAIIGDTYLKTYGIQLKAGRNFTAEECKVDWNRNSKVLLNERAVEQLGFKSAEDAINTKVQWDERFLDVIGVVKDYHHSGLQRAIEPIVFSPQVNTGYVSIRVTPGEIQQKMAKLEKIYKSYFTGNPFEYFFVDENFNKQYVTESQYSKVFTTASVWAIFIACLGLFGLATFTVESRTKEIGIRKVLGASVAGIVRLLSLDFIKLVFAAILIACPLAWYFMTGWLADFEYQIKITWWMFAAGGSLAIIIAVLTIGFQSIRAALVNPVRSLKSE